MPRLTAITAFCALAGSVWASPLTLEPLVIVGESYGDMPGVVSQTSGESQINNSGQWVTRVAGTDAGGSFLGTYIFTHDGIRHDPFTVVPFNENLTFRTSPPNAFYSSINNHGQIATTFNGLVSDADGNLVGSRSMIAVDGSPVVRTGDTTPFGGTYGGFGSTRHILNDQGHLLANFDLIGNPFSTFETVIEFSPGESGYDQTVRMTPGVPLQDGFTVRGTYNASWGSFDVSSNGDTAFGVVVTNSDQIPRNAIVVNGVIRRISGPIDDYPDGSFSLNARQVATNDFGEFAYSGLMGSTDWDGGRVTIYRNEDEVVWFDDRSDPLLQLSHITSATNIKLTNHGDVFWQGLIQDDSTTYSALFRNDLLIATSDPRIASEEVIYFEEYFQFDISDNGEWIIFDTPDGIYRAMTPSPSTTAILMVGLISSLRRRR